MMCEKMFIENLFCIRSRKIDPSFMRRMSFMIPVDFSQMNRYLDSYEEKKPAAAGIVERVRDICNRVVKDVQADRELALEDIRNAVRTLDIESADVIVHLAKGALGVGVENRPRKIEGEEEGPIAAKRGKTIPTLKSRDEIKTILDTAEGGDTHNAKRLVEEFFCYALSGQYPEGSIDDSIRRGMVVLLNKYVAQGKIPYQLTNETLVCDPIFETIYSIAARKVTSHP
jgi:hypothetical protein